MAVKLGAFELLARLSSTATTNVFLGRLPSGELASIEILRPNFASLPEHVAEMFMRAKTGAQLDHPNIVRLLAFSQVNGVHCLACEHVFGVRLSEVLAVRTLPAEIALAIASSVIHAIDHPKTARISELGADHVLLAFEGAVKVTGFEEDPRPDRSADAAALLAMIRASSPDLAARIPESTRVASLGELFLALGPGARPAALPAFLASIFSRRIRDGQAALASGDEAQLAAAFGATVSAKEIPSIPGGASKPDLLGLFAGKRVVPQQAMTGIDPLPVRRMETPTEAKTEIAPLPVRQPPDDEATIPELPAQEDYAKIVEDLDIGPGGKKR